MSDEQYALPEGWAWAALGDVVSIGSTQVLPKRTPEEPFNYVALEHIEPGTGRILNLSPTLGRNIGSNKYTFRVGDVLYGKLRPYLRKATVAKFDGVSATDLIPLRTLGPVEASYLQRYLLSPQALNYVHPLMAGIKMPRLRSGDLRVMPIPLAPLSEQRRIVAKIEALLEQSRTARQALDRVPPLLKKFRQGVLAAAFRGDLTRDWREQHPDIEPAAVLLERIGTERRRKWEENLGSGHRKPRKKNEEIMPVDTSGLLALPQTWVWANLGQVLEVVQYGTSVKASASAMAGIRILRMGNIRDGRLDLSDLKYFDPGEEDTAGYTLERGDILINRTNSPELVGKAALFNCEGTYVFASYLIRLRPYRDVSLPAFLNFAINSHVGRRHVEDVKHQVAGQANINTKDIRSMPIPLPPIEEQEHIVARIDDLFAAADAIEAAVKAARQRAEKVEQSILARAFRGELVPQDPDDEPASVLLMRIGTERGMAGAFKRPRSDDLGKRKHHAAKQMASG